jgi:oxalate decarboxylase/phosphoglucose isomerase-like protein (cupin superfamily)
VSEDGRFFARGELAWETPYWGRMAWIARPDVTGSRDIVVGEVEFAPGSYHHFHYHPGQEEVLYVLDGRVEQWLDSEHRSSGRASRCSSVGTSCTRPSTSTKVRPRIVVVVGPCVGAEGYVAVEAADREPWSGLRPT